MKRVREDKPDIPIAPMIDCVFLMLVYFMVTSSLERTEADLAFSLPGSARGKAQTVSPRPSILHVDAIGSPRIQGRSLGSATDPSWPALDTFLQRYRSSSEAFGEEFTLQIQPHPQTPHGAIVRVLEALHRAKVDGFQLLPAKSSPK